NWNAGTTAPAGSTSILRSPPVMSLTFLAKSSAYSWKMSFDGQVLWNRMLIGPCALTTAGALTAAAVATAAPLKTNRRWVASLDVRDRSVLSVLMGVALLGFPNVSPRHSRTAWVYNRPDSSLFR